MSGPSPQKVLWMGKCPCKWCDSYKHCLQIPRWMCLQIYLKRPIYEKTSKWRNKCLKKEKAVLPDSMSASLEERHKYCLPHNTEKCVMNVATVKPSLFRQLKQTECVISWLLLPNPKSQEDYMPFESSSTCFLQAYLGCCKSSPCLHAPNLCKAIEDS